ncbi:MAG: hypothetical protein HRU15_12115, partial [Planctomycetes bacterium]|nr:hypothetical protein [Planctomycetota bacterium]
MNQRIVYTITLLIFICFAHLSAASKKNHNIPQISKKEIKQLIAEAGKTKPDWWDSCTLNYPKSIDIHKTRIPKSGWNSNVNATDYIVDRIYPNPKKWNEGIKLLHLIRSNNKGNDKALK